MIMEITDQKLIESMANEVFRASKDNLNDSSKIMWCYDYDCWKTDEGDLFDPINNANHWMMILERMRMLGFNGKIEVYLTGMYEVEFYQRQGGSWVSCQELIGKAVCLAALEAVRGSK
jgi:hypothetical protein